MRHAKQGFSLIEVLMTIGMMTLVTIPMINLLNAQQVQMKKLKQDSDLIYTANTLFDAVDTRVSPVATLFTTPGFNADIAITRRYSVLNDVLNPAMAAAPPDTKRMEKAMVFDRNVVYNNRGMLGVTIRLFKTATSPAFLTMRRNYNIDNYAIDVGVNPGGEVKLPETRLVNARTVLSMASGALTPLQYSKQNPAFAMPDPQGVFWTPEYNETRPAASTAQPLLYLGRATGTAVPNSTLPIPYNTSTTINGQSPASYAFLVRPNAVYRVKLLTLCGGTGGNISYNFNGASANEVTLSNISAGAFCSFGGPLNGTGSYEFEVNTPGSAATSAVTLSVRINAGMSLSGIQVVRRTDV
jgi:hypothetical protein